MKLNIGELLGSLKSFEMENHTRILTGASIVCTVGAVLWSLKGGCKARDIVEQYKQKNSENLERLKNSEIPQIAYEEDKKDAMTECAKGIAFAIAPSVVLTAASIIFAVKAQTDNEHTIETLTTTLAAAKIANNKAIESLKLRDKKELEVLGNAKSQEIREEVVKDKVGSIEAPDPNDALVEHTGKGETLCYDPFLDKFFFSSYEGIGQAIVRSSADIRDEMDLTVGDFYRELGLKRIPDMANYLGWRVENCDRGMLPITRTSMLTDDGRPCICLDYDVSLLAERR